eukprot:TRINITY_DN22915_c0_g6_i1.p1 TRINITY_DN22915_c0_g6~~TRINITY_DN22915_c0_g6_i1.p1  ORF type:complete len:599 (-),score=70.51 TRINITY_DN22915_c0_g6_i1:52-1848(-)
MEPLLIDDGPSPATPAVEHARACTTNSLQDNSVLCHIRVVFGISVRSRNVGVDVEASLKALVGGENQAMQTLCETSRDEAFEHMRQQAHEGGGNAVVGVRYDSSCIAPWITEVVAYGTAVADSMTASSSDRGEGTAAVRVTTANEIPGYDMCHSLGIVQGISVRTPTVVAALGAGLRSLAGGEIVAFTRMCRHARRQAYDRMVEHALQLGANGIVAMRYSTNELRDGVCEMFAFGTAVTCIARDTLDTAAGDAGIAEGMITTSNRLPDLRTQYSFGFVEGISVRSCPLHSTIGANVKALFGGEIKTWTSLSADCRTRAFNLMVEQAHQRGAKGIVAMRYDCNQFGNGIVEIVAYGTAVSDEPPCESPSAALADNTHCTVSTDLDIPGCQAQHTLGTVRGASVRSNNIVLGIGTALKTAVGGEINNCRCLSVRTRQDAFTRMVEHAADLGATGIACMRYESSHHHGVLSIVAYGTAVWDGSTPCSPPVASPGRVPLACTCTTDELVGHTISRSLGMVRGLHVRSNNVFVTMGANVKSTFWGTEITTWTNLCDEVRQEALESLLSKASALGAHGVAALRYSTLEIAPGIVEFLVYGTAVE